MKSLLTAVILLGSLFSHAQSQKYSWETQQAKVLPNGDLEWAPNDFEFKSGNSVRYIDFENGTDINDGLTTSTPWKHHPWDPEAIGKADNTTGIHTYVFKRGVIYRGYLLAMSSGTNTNPIRLTSDPGWGKGEAAIYGSVKIEDGWTKADETTAPNIPNPEMVWYKDIGDLENLTKLVCEVTDSSVNRIYLARSPNFVNTPDEPMKTWWSFTGKAAAGDNLNLTDTKNLVEADVNHYKGGDIWAIENAIVMATLWKQKIQDYNPSTNTLKVSTPNFGGKNCKYYVENTPYMLDAPGEYYYDRIKRRIYIRLNNDKDPNTTTVEVASRNRLILLSGRNNIEISGLTFGFTTCDDLRLSNEDGKPAILIMTCSNITIKNCKFHYLNGGIRAGGGNGKNIVISDNEMNYMDDFCIFTYGPEEVSVLRNKIFETGTRHLSRWYGSIPAIAGTMSVGEIAGNIIEHSWGSGINITWGKGGSSDATIPFIRGFMHHNKVSHSLQGVNDYGGIEAWQGGPVFLYNNISDDAQGWHYDWGTQRVSLGYAFYLDGSFKNYVFNNIAKGRAWHLNSAAYMHVLGFYNYWVHNVAYNLGELTFSGDGNLAPDGQNYYLANVSDSTKLQFNHTTRQSGIPFESYAKNVFSQNSFEGTFVTNSPGGRLKLNFSDFVDLLNSYTPDLGSVGFEASKRVFANPAKNDFRPTESSELIDQGVKFFVPFPLSRVVGEWHFNKHREDSTLIKGENFYFTSEFNNRETYNDVPKNHLKAYGLTTESFVMGDLEDWAEGALMFDGIQTFCSADHNIAGATVCNNVDMTDNSFILECYFKTDENFTNGNLISKFGDTGLGYQLDVDQNGNIRFSIIENGSFSFSQAGSTPVNKGNWHHVLAEVNRLNEIMTLYIDGVLANGASTGTLPLKGISLTNTSDLLIGKNKDGNFFSGEIDFIRISKGTLNDGKTTIDELYKWEFNGSFLYDFAGNSPIGKRDAGALEKGGKLCNMTVSGTSLNFGLTGGTKSFTIDAEMGFEVTRKRGSFFYYSVEGNKINVTANPMNSGTRAGEIHVYGCNETRTINVVQSPYTDSEIVKEDQVRIMPNPVSKNEQLSIHIPGNIKTSRVQFIDMSGKIVGEKSLNGVVNNINIKLPTGLYVLKILGEEINYTTKLGVY